MDELLNVVVRSIQTGAIYGSIALGLNVVIGSTNTFNFAHGEAVVIGSVVGVILWTSFGLPVVVAAVLAIIAAAILGALTDLIAVRPLGERHGGGGHGLSFTPIVSTLAIALLAAALLSLAIVRNPGDSGTRPFPDFLPWTGTYNVGGVLLTPARLFPIVGLVVMVALVRWFHQRTTVGRALAALGDDREAAAMRGLPVKRLGTLAFALGAALGAATGFAAGPVTQASLEAGLSLTLKGFAAVALGGMPKMSGAVVGGLVLGAIEQFTAGYLDTRLQDPIVLLVLVTMLYLRPQGIVGQRYRTV